MVLVVANHEEIQANRTEIQSVRKYLVIATEASDALQRLESKFQLKIEQIEAI